MEPIFSRLFELLDDEIKPHVHSGIDFALGILSNGGNVFVVFGETGEPVALFVNKPVAQRKSWVHFAGSLDAKALDSVLEHILKTTGAAKLILSSVVDSPEAESLHGPDQSNNYIFAAILTAEVLLQGTVSDMVLFEKLAAAPEEIDVFEEVNLEPVEKQAKPPMVVKYKGDEEHMTPEDYEEREKRLVRLP